MLSPALFPALLLIASFLYSCALMRLALRPWEQARDQHWTERARWLWQSRKSRAAVVLGIVLVSWPLYLQLVGDDPSLPSLVFPALGGFMVAQFFIDRRIWPGLSLRLWLMQTFTMFGIASALIGTIAWVAACTSENLNSTDWLRIGIAALLLIVLYSGVWLFAIPGRGKNPLTPRLCQMVDSVAAKAGMPPVRAWVADGVMANAFALMYIRSIVATGPAMRVLDDDELRTLVQHEMAHLSESAPVLAARMLGGLSWLGFAFTRPVVHHIGHGGVFWIFLAVILVKRFAANIAKRMENRADSMSVTDESEGPIYARALEKLYEANQMPAMMTKRLLHPHLYDRMIAAGLTPGYPRPAPPPGKHWTFYAAILPAALWLGIKLAQNS
ncbi:MAG: M48 family metalloprotease [Verrucomicrobia bacterium]|nr:M48 family metalloprotease [Verrucomicrobiota bacterium]